MAKSKTNKKDSWNDFKRSACTISVIKKGKSEGLIAINAWRATKNGLVTLKAFEHNESTEGKTSTNKEYIVLMCEIVNADAGSRSVVPGFYYPNEKKLRISSMNLVASANGSGKTKTGKYVTGFFGKIKTK